MTTLFDALVATARELDALHEGAANGTGSAAQIIDSRLTALGWQDDDFVGGTALVILNSDTPGVTPQGDSRIISDFVAATGVITIDTSWGGSVSLNDWYGLITNRYPRGLLVSKINEALRETGDIPTIDTTLTTAADTLEYSLPVAAKRDLRQVWLARSLTAPWDWEPLLTVRTEWSAANAVASLIFPTQPRAGYKIKLVYMAPHGHVGEDASLISDYISIDWLGVAAALKCARFRLSQAGSDDKTLTPLINDLMTREQARRRARRMAMPMSFPVFAPNLDGALPS
jgi:hypothetical protein